MYRTLSLPESPLSSITHQICAAFGVESKVLPATDDIVRTRVRIDEGWISFQEYFVDRRHRDEVHELAYEGSQTARPAPGVLESIIGADTVVIAPSNPPMSIWPILAIPGIRDAVSAHPRVVAVSPLIGGTTVKGPADKVLLSLGLAPGNAGVAAAYEGLIDVLVIDESDRDDAPQTSELEIVATSILIPTLESGAQLAKEILFR